MATSSRTWRETDSSVCCAWRAQQNFYLTTKLSQVTSPGSESTELTLKTLLDEQQRETQHLLDEQRRLRGVAEESQGQLRRALAENAAMRRATPTMPPNEPLFDEEQKVFGQPHDCATIEAVRAAHQEVRESSFCLPVCWEKRT